MVEFGREAKIKNNNTTLARNEHVTRLYVPVEFATACKAINPSAN
jgi:hypothetical protein